MDRIDLVPQGFRLFHSLLVPARVASSGPGRGGICFESLQKIPHAVRRQWLQLAT